MLRRRGRWVAALAAAATLAGAAVALDSAFPPDLSRLADRSVMVTDRSGAPLRAFLNGADSWRLPATVEDVAPVYLDLLLAYEDKRFRDHMGVDPLAVLRAAGQNLTAGRVVSGASTLTMQVARLLEPKPRTLWAKLREARLALALERRFDKDAILGMYLTLAPFGGNLEGVRAATSALFGKRPAELTVAEAALLVALPRSPTALRPERSPERARAARDAVLDRAVAVGALDAKAAAEAKAEPVPDRLFPMPATAPHLAERARREAPGQVVVRTTIDGPLQRALEDLTRRSLADLHDKAGIAVVVADHRTREVLAYIGAPDALDHRRFGPIDMVEARRSPGSALKPFIYGLGFDDGVIHPETLIADVSTRFGDYAPRNFDRDFSGELTVREALQRSLNVPAVLVLDKVGPVRFTEALRRTGVRLALPRGTALPGLPVALGGASISLWDMAALYAGLAHEGRVAPLRIRPDAPPGEEHRLMEPESARRVLRILEGAALPPGMVQAADVRRRAAIAVKTGTSYGFRDAWAFGVSGRHVVGVWTGRPDGTPSPDRYGRNTAAPLLHRVFDLLPSDPAGPVDRLATGRPAALLDRIGAGLPGLDVPERLRLVFPADGMALEAMGGDGQAAPLPLEASGGRRPLAWLVDGRRVAVSPVRRDILWRPDGPGTVRITVVDADGRSDSAVVDVR